MKQVPAGLKNGVGLKIAPQHFSAGLELEDRKNSSCTSHNVIKSSHLEKSKKKQFCFTEYALARIVEVWRKICMC